MSGVQQIMDWFDNGMQMYFVNPMRPQQAKPKRDSDRGKLHRLDIVPEMPQMDFSPLPSFLEGYEGGNGHQSALNSDKLFPVVADMLSVCFCSCSSREGGYHRLDEVVLPCNGRSKITRFPQCVDEGSLVYYSFKYYHEATPLDFSLLSKRSKFFECINKYSGPVISDKQLDISYPQSVPGLPVKCEHYFSEQTFEFAVMMLGTRSECRYPFRTDQYRSPLSKIRRDFVHF